MIGSIIGDIVGSVFEFNNEKSKDFLFFDEDKSFTDDSVLSVATADWLMNGGDPGTYYYRYAKKYPNPMGGYGTGFNCWHHQCTPSQLAPAYDSCGNGSAMRVSAVGWAYETLEETLDAAKKSAECTHNHPEGIKGAQAVAHAIFMARHGAFADEIKAAISNTYGYNLSLSVDEIRSRYSWEGLDGTGVSGATCQGSVPEAIICALEAVNFEDAVRNAVSIGGDSDTIACISGGIAEALFGIPDELMNEALEYLDEDLKETVVKFHRTFCLGKAQTDNKEVVVALINDNKINCDMPLSDQIQEIVDLRKGTGHHVGEGHLEKIDNCLSFFTDLKSKVEEYEEFRQTLLADADVQGSEYYAYFKEDSMLKDRVEDADSKSVSEKLDKCIEECNRLHSRFNRDTINISVIGLAGQGKSRLLQAISGLEDSVIPAAAGGDCTGTTSIICNEVGTDSAHATVVFFAKEEMKAHVNAYLSAMDFTTTVASFEAIPSLKESVIKPYDNGGKAKMTAEQKALFKHFRKYVEHFDDYKGLVDIGKVEANENEIRSYVAQFDETGKATFSYLAVKDVKIYKQFNYPEAGRIVLVDTIGLGDTSLGIEDKMLKTLKNESDAAFMIKLPAKTRAHWGKEDVK